MADMERAVKEIRGFLELQRETEVALWSERDDAKLAAKIAELNTHYAGDLTTLLYRGPGKGAEWFKERKAEIADTRTAPLFRVARYAHRKHGDLYAADVGTNLQDDDSYFSRLYFAEVDGKLRVLSQYNRCQVCAGTGEEGGKKCSECRGSGWNWRGGPRFARLGKAKEVARLQEPGPEADRAEYDAD